MEKRNWEEVGQENGSINFSEENVVELLLVWHPLLLLLTV